MKLSIVVALLFLASTVSLAQNNRPVKVNLLAYFDRIPSPPISSKEAHGKCECDSNYNGVCKADKLFKSFEDDLMKLQNDISSPPDTPSGNLMKKMQDPAFQKEMDGH
ncbi:MAG: hypothetical protein ABI623_08420, partial [bacterium]